MTTVTAHKIKRATVTGHNSMNSNPVERCDNMVRLLSAQQRGRHSMQSNLVCWHNMA